MTTFRRRTCMGTECSSPAVSATRGRLVGSCTAITRGWRWSGPSQRSERDPASSRALSPPPPLRSPPPRACVQAVAWGQHWLRMGRLGSSPRERGSRQNQTAAVVDGRAGDTTQVGSRLIRVRLALPVPGPGRSWVFPAPLSCAQPTMHSTAV